MTYVATRDFNSSKHGEFKEGKTVKVPDEVIAAWKKSGLVREEKEPARPLAPAGRKSPASRPARASRATTASELVVGDPPLRDVLQSSSTAHSDSLAGPMSSTQPTPNGGETTT